jgi:hypothetical protein
VRALGRTWANDGDVSRAGDVGALWDGADCDAVWEGDGTVDESGYPSGGPTGEDCPEGLRRGVGIREAGDAGEFLSDGDGGWKRRRDGGSSRLADDMIEETVEAERETLFLTPRTSCPVSSACGQGVVQMVFMWAQA